jgi:hypothetical protein
VRSDPSRLHGRAAKTHQDSMARHQKLVLLEVRNISSTHGAEKRVK